MDGTTESNDVVATGSDNEADAGAEGKQTAVANATGSLLMLTSLSTA